MLVEKNELSNVVTTVRRYFFINITSDDHLITSPPAYFNPILANKDRQIIFVKNCHALRYVRNTKTNLHLRIFSMDDYGSTFL